MQLCAEHNHPLNDELNDKGMPPRARTTPAKGVRALASAADRAYEPPVDGPYQLPTTFLPAMSAWPSVTPSGIKVRSKIIGMASD
jgi:hypothetical protein